MLEDIDIGWQHGPSDTVSIVHRGVLHGVLALANDVNRPKKSLQPLVLSIHAFLFAARSFCSVNPTVCQWRGLSEGGAAKRTDSGSPGAAVEGFFMVRLGEGKASPVAPGYCPSVEADRKMRAGGNIPQMIT
jgi:hypothetical protein